MGLLNTTTKKLFIIIVIALFGILFFAIYYNFNPSSEGNLFPRCPFLLITGYQCPGCGSQRAIHSLLHLDIAKAFSYNPILIISIPYLIIISIIKYRLKTSNSEKLWKFRNILMGKNAIIIIAITFISFWILRNIL